MDSLVEVEVEFPYTAEQPDELTIKVGDIIKNVVMEDGGWWEGELNGKKGMFPDNFVKVRKNPEKETAKKDEGKKKDVQATKRQSVKDLANKLKLGQVGHDGPPLMKRKDINTKKKRAKVVFSYEPEQDDELKLEIGDMVDVLKQEEEGWWEGIVNGKQGMFPSNFVEIIEEGESTETAVENTEDRLIKGKKVQGVGLGNIFNDGPIKLRKTDKSMGNSQEPPKAEKREEPAIRKPKGVVHSSDRNLAYAQIELNCMQLNHEKSLSEIHPSFTEDIDYMDDDKNHYIDSFYNQKSLNRELVDYDQIDVSCIKNDSCMYYTEGYNNNNNAFGMSAQQQITTESSKQDIQGVMNILGDLDDCLQQQSLDQNPSSTSLAPSEGCNDSRALEGEDVPKRLERMETLACWEQMDLTPPQKLSFCKAIDSVYVMKKRQFDSAEKTMNSTPLRMFENNYVNTERITKVLTFGEGDPLGGFVKFTPVTDCHGHSVLVPKSIESYDTSFHSPALTKVSEAQTSTPRSPKTYLQSLNKSGTLSPFIKSITDKYKLFGPPTPHFKPINVDVSEDVSYGSFMLQHAPDVSFEEEKEDETANTDVDAQSPSDAAINQMLNNYVYDVVCGARNSDIDACPSKSESDSKLGSNVASNISMVVCLDENSVRQSREELAEDSIDSHKLQSSLESSALLSMMEGNNGSLDISQEPAANELRQVDQEEVPDVHPLESMAHNPAVSPMIMKQNSVSSSPAYLSKHVQKSANERTLPGSGKAVQNSSYCRIPFTCDAPSFWFSKDFSESPRSQSQVLRVKSPKRSSSELIAACDNMKNTENGGNSHLLTNCGAAFVSGDQSPAKKRRRRTVSDIDMATESNENQNAIVELPIEDVGVVEAYFVKTDGPYLESVHVDVQIQNVASDTKLDAEIPMPENTTRFCGPSKSTSKSRSGIYLSGSLENDSIFIDACSEKRQKRGFFRWVRSPAQKNKENVKLLKYTKLSSTPHSAAKKSNETSSKSALNKSESSIYDSMFRLHPESIKRCQCNESVSCEVQSRRLEAAGGGLDNAVLWYFAHDYEDDALIKSEEECKIPKEKCAGGDERTTDTTDEVKYSVEALAETRYNLYSAFSSAVQACSDLVGERKTEDDRFVGYNKETGGDITPDPDTLVRELQGLDLSETPQYANTDNVDKEMRAVLNDAIGSLDNILIDSFASSLTESPVKEVDMDKDMAECTDVDDKHGTQAIELEQLVLHVVGRKYLLHEPEHYKVLKDDTADETVEVHDDSILNIIGTKCQVHEAGNDNNELEYVPLDVDGSAEDKPVHISIHSCSSNNVNFDEAYDVEECAEMSDFPTSTPMPSTAELQRLQSKKVRNPSTRCEKQPSFWCPSWQESKQGTDVLDDSLNDWGKNIENEAEFVPEYDYYPTEESLKVDEFETSMASEPADDGPLNRSRGSSLLDFLQDQDGEDLAEISVQFENESFTDDDARWEYSPFAVGPSQFEDRVSRYPGTYETKQDLAD